MLMIEKILQILLDLELTQKNVFKTYSILPGTHPLDSMVKTSDKFG